MFETFGFETLTPVTASLYLALAIGVAFGALAEITRFCLRRAVVGPASSDKRQAGGIWLTALATALLGTQAAVSLELITFAEHRFLAADLPILAIVLGGLAFGVGMVLTRGCASRLTVLSGTGNLRALTVILVFAVTAHATIKGVFAPLRTALGGVTVPLGEVTSLAALPGGGLLWAALLATLALTVAMRSGNSVVSFTLAGLIGLLVPLAWVGTGFILFDEFDPIALQSLSFTQPTADALFWGIASTAIKPGFGVGLFGGVIAGAALSALVAGRFVWQSFSSPSETGRYLSGGVLMGFGGALAGGCTVGAGLAGLPTLGFSAFLTLGSIIAGAKLAEHLLNESGSVFGAQPATPVLQPAE